MRRNKARVDMLTDVNGGNDFCFLGFMSTRHIATDRAGNVSQCGKNPQTITITHYMMFFSP